MSKKEIAREAVQCLSILRELASEEKAVSDIEVQTWLHKYYQLLLDYSKDTK